MAPDNATMETSMRHCSAGVEGNANGKTDGDMRAYEWAPEPIYMGIGGKGWAGLTACAVAAGVGTASVIWFSNRCWQ